MSFSQRKGLKTSKKIQVSGMDDALRNGLWNVLTVHFWARSKGGYVRDLDPYLLEFINALWMGYFDEPIDIIPYLWSDAYNYIRKHFFASQWNEVYDFLEFATKFPDESVSMEFIADCNLMLEREASAYRFVGRKVAQMTSTEEIREIETVLEMRDPLKLTQEHIKRALELFSDRRTPDYRNSIKESISAVEALCRLITNSKEATLGQALKQVEKKVPIHPALKSAFSSLYGYSSSAGGIRHALMDESDLKTEDARFMLVSCSAFINYLVTKSSEAGIRF